MGPTDPAMLLSNTGRWSTSNCQCWSGDRTRYATSAGGRASISRTWAAGDHVALVMENAPNRPTAAWCGIRSCPPVPTPLA